MIKLIESIANNLHHLCYPLDGDFLQVILKLIMNICPGISKDLVVLRFCSLIEIGPCGYISSECCTVQGTHIHPIHGAFKNFDAGDMRKE